MLGPWLFKRTVSEVVASKLEDLFTRLRTRDDLKEYLIVKHYLAVRAALDVYHGRQAGRPQDRATIETITHGPEGVQITAHLDVAGLTDDIRACQNCCGDWKPGASQSRSDG
jgi:hypothetical protein